MRAVYSHGSTNQIIGNIKKNPSVPHIAQGRYKLSEMRWVVAATFVRQGQYR
ncbi:MAG: hypothetical protein KKA44_07970 [Alphaproteobacteria bacterium]|nr:hypothetical protein [Alphaproteobacteria bacterium]MBU0864321.1 hypothetical protein [Alphaproteobacteria bacterium]MBU1824897.1 hypothetical protein [Alphaproteobacteria bacterium]